MKVLVFSCNMGSTATNTIVKQTVPFDFLRFDDTNFPTRFRSMKPRLVGKIPKMLGWDIYDHPEYDAYIWIDAPFSMKKSTSIQWYLDQLGDKEAAFFKHPNRSTVQEELHFMKELMKNGDQYLLQRYEGEPMYDQVATYLEDKTWNDDKLFACTSFIYSKKLIENKDYNLLKEWFYHNCRWSVQDQLSLPYLLHKFGTKYNIIEGDSYKTLLNL